MADTEPTPAPKSPATFVGGTIAIFVVLIGSCAAYYLWPRGDRLGALDLRAESPSLSVDVGAGDKLTFRIDTVTVGLDCSLEVPKAGVYTLTAKVV